MSQNLGPLTLVPNTPQVVTIPNANAAAFLKVTNGTPYDLSYSGFGVKGTSVIPAGTEYLLHGDILNTGSIYLVAVNNVNSSITSAIVNVVAFYDDEQPPRGTWPITVPTQVVNTAVTTANFLTNTNTAAGSNIIDIQPVGDPSATYTVDNSGNVVIGTASHQGSWTKGTGAAQVNVDSTGTLTVQNRIVANLIKTVTGNDLTLDVETGHKIALQINNTDVVQITASSVALLSGVASTLIANLVKGSAANNLSLDADTGQKISMQINVTEIAKFTATGNDTAINQTSTFAVGGDLKLGNNNTSNLYFTDGSKLASMHGISGSSGVATNHNCPKQPQYYWAVPDRTAGVTTINVTAISATQITVTTGNGGNWIGSAITFN